MTAHTHPFRQLKYPTVPLHLANDWLAAEYRRAVQAIDAQTIGSTIGAQ
jgi:hypothetical protein